MTAVTLMLAYKHLQVIVHAERLAMINALQYWTLLTLPIN